MRTASALIGACIDRCAPCQRSLADRLLDEEAIVLAVLAGSVYTLHAESEADAGALASRATQVFFGLVKHAREYRDPGMLPAAVEMLPRDSRAAILEDTLDMWTYYGHVDAGLLRERYPSPTGLSTVTVTVEGSAPEKAGPGVVVDLSALGHPAAYGVRTDMTRTGSGLVASVALVPESPDAGYDDLCWRCGWDPDIFQGLPRVEPAWVLKIDRTSGALLGIVRLLDATLLPERQPWEWRQDVYDRILWRARCQRRRSRRPSGGDRAPAGHGPVVRPARRGRRHAFRLGAVGVRPRLLQVRRPSVISTLQGEPDQ